MKSDLHDLKKLTLELLKNGASKVQENNQHLIQKIYGTKENDSDSEIEFEEQEELALIPVNKKVEIAKFKEQEDNYLFAETVEDVEEEILKLEQKEIEMIKKSLEKNKGKRKAAADELGISERTLYRKIKQFDL
jgi:transcriptional regulator with PAS, ATPase and Fis domain